MVSDRRPVPADGRRRFIAEHLVLTGDEIVVHSPGVVDVLDGVVEWSGPEAAAPAFDGGVVNLSGVLLPGFVNIHCHTPMVLLRGAGEGLPVDRWLREVIFPREAKLGAADVAAAMRLGAAEALTGGITTTQEMYFHSGTIAEAAIDAGLRSVITAPLIEAVELLGVPTIDEQFAEIEALAEQYRGHDLIEIGIGPHSAYVLSEQVLSQAARVAADHDLVVHIHVAETRFEGDGVTERTGLTVPAYLDKLGLFDGRAVAAHCVWLTEGDVELLAAAGVGVAHCPCSNGKHASGLAPVTDLRAAGVKVGVATDGPSSSNRLDMFEEMRMALRLARLREGDAAAITAAELLAMATSEPADALGRPELGRLDVGSPADMFHLDLSDTRFVPRFTDTELIAQIVWSGSPEAVTDVWVGGRHVVDGGAHASIDAAALADEVSTRAAALADG